MMTRLNFPSASKSKKLQLCMSFSEPSCSSPMYPCSVATLPRGLLNDDVADLVTDRLGCREEVGEHAAYFVRAGERHVVGLHGERRVVREVR